MAMVRVGDLFLEPLALDGGVIVVIGMWKASKFQEDFKELR